MQTFTAALFIVASKCKQLKWPSADGWASKMWYVHKCNILFCYKRIKYWCILQSLQRGPYRVWFHLYEMSRRGKFMRKRLLAAWTLGRSTGGWLGTTANESGGLLRWLRMFWNEIVVMVVWLYEYTKNHWIGCFKRVNFMVCELYLNFKKLHEKGKAISLGSLSDPLEIGLSFEHTCVCVCVCVCTHTQSCPTLCNPMDCSLPGSSAHGIFQARIMEQVAISYCRGSFQPRDQTHISCISCIYR